MVPHDQQPVPVKGLLVEDGMFGIGPITDPKDIAPAIKRALEVVKRGEPALIDTVTQPR